ncbi:hypothetical protein DJ83_17405 [Halorubrum ezzemoulense]|uniref:Uncharacterized protein n=1 Tax=Halorubrum ezzemoulense TaxID=337243 RepID=A0A256IL33_HALEZ|nr:MULTISPECIES: hypothetical protein [Halorubrum]OYR57244.1 hypothetical protein DJ83_17405 [Halorubrum ezzemoulense]OYR79511.1 hypothetical protein DJ84_17770 [Halorubrum ezzemoulense]PHQ44080.1 hypothetical protein Z052_00605 [Halorubrum sp. C191]QAY21499.1 hypothetical protein EO776_15990 [Halorubrum ezzemoulense]
MSSIESFPIKRGTARFTEDYVYFQESFLGYIKSLYRDYWQRGTWWSSTVLVGYLFVFPIGIWWVVSVVRGGNFLYIAALGGSILVLWAVNYARGFRSPDRIRLDAIQQVSATDGIKGLTRPRLVIKYTDARTTCKRRVNLPSLYTRGGETGYEQAREAFAERGF